MKPSGPEGPPTHGLGMTRRQAGTSTAGVRYSTADRKTLAPGYRVPRCRTRDPIHDVTAPQRRGGGRAPLRSAPRMNESPTRGPARFSWPIDQARSERPRLGVAVRPSRRGRRLPRTHRIDRQAVPRSSIRKSGQVESFRSFLRLSDDLGWRSSPSRLLRWWQDGSLAFAAARWQSP